MAKLLNKGLNFTITPLKLNITQILVDWQKFERKMRWREYFADSASSFKPSIFPKSDKTNLPKEKPPKPLEMFLSASKSDLLGSLKLNRKISGPNITEDEKSALNDLIQLQKGQIITIKPCDKGAGIIICNFGDYIDSHL